MALHGHAALRVEAETESVQEANRPAVAKAPNVKCAELDAGDDEQAGGAEVSEIRRDEWVGMTKSARRYEPFWESVREAEAQGRPVMHVVKVGKFIMQASTDIELAKLFAEHQVFDQDEVGEFDWVPDEFEVLHLRFKNTRTGEWEPTIQSISTAPALPEAPK
ncbi:hypothetical protein [Streptomyces sp. NPDC051642]|uniref:hypothetical protein n=1 Tax=unclassified Streptomyces TaxID=2593676 RepID=UPI00343DCE5F